MTHMTLYKFLNSEDTVHLCGTNPSLQFGRLNYYRLLEAVTGDHRIGDVNEGVAETQIRNIQIDDTSSIDDKRELERVGFLEISENAGNKVTISNAIIQQKIDCFVLSLGMGDFEALANEFARGGPNAYDAALRLTSLENLLERISRSMIDGISLEENYIIQHGPVEYQELNPGDFSVNRRVESPNPFVKDRLRYGNQAEYRIVLIPKTKAADLDHIRFTLPDGESLFEKVAIKDSTRNKPAPSPAGNIDDFLDVIRECFEEWENRKVISIDMQAPNWIEMANLRSEQEMAIFPHILRRIANGYWSIRSQYRNFMLDEAIFSRMPPMIFFTRVALFARKFDQNIAPPR